MAIQQIQHGHGATIYPSDTESISDYLQVYGRSTCLYIGTGGNLRVLTVGGDDVTFRNVQSGQFLPVMVTKVFLTGTTASNITVVDMGPGRFRGLLFDYSKRVSFDGGVVEAGACVDAVSGLLQSASLLLIPSGYKGGKLYAEIPTNGNGDLTWTRGSDAFRTNASGVIQRVPWNLLQYSEAFDNGVYTKIATTITSNTTTAPNGTLTADKLVSTSVSSSHSIYQNLGSVGDTRVISCFVKKAEYRYITLQYGTASVRFDFDTLTFSGGTSNSYTDEGNGWYRVSCLLTATVNARATILIPDNSANITYVGDDVSGTFIWGFQAVEGTTAQTYLPTTDRLNFPRLSYMYGSCPSVLLEPQRTNLALWSNDFTNAIWTKSGATITANTTTSPDGTQNASTVTFTASNQFVAQTCLTLSTNATASVWLLGTSGETIQIACGGLDQLVTLTGSWQRFSLNRASVTNTAVNINTFGGATARVVRIYGFQAEVGSYPTTYIPTTSATATRVADTFSRNNIYTNGLISASGGTWFVELRGNVVYGARDGNEAIGVGDTTALTTNSLRLFVNTSGTVQVVKYVSSTLTTLISTSTSTVKIAIKWNGTSADVFINGSKVVTATAFTTTNMEWLTGNAGVPFFVKQMALYPSPLSDTDCQLLTAL